MQGLVRVLLIIAQALQRFCAAVQILIQALQIVVQLLQKGCAGVLEGFWGYRGLGRLGGSANQHRLMTLCVLVSFLKNIFTHKLGNQIKAHYICFENVFIHSSIQFYAAHRTPLPQLRRYFGANS